MALHYTAEVALVRESAARRDFRNGRVRFQQFAASRLDAQFANEITDATGVSFTESSRQMDGMHLYLPGNIAKRQVFAVAFTQNLANTWKPVSRTRFMPSFPAGAQGFREEFQTQAFGR
jgi:hypothetical protein